MTLKNYGSYVFVAVISMIILFFNLGAIPLLDPDEPVYAQTPVEMLSHQEFISPRIYGEYWYDKPPMYYWLVAASYKLFGVSDFAARFPSALLAVACVLAVLYFGKRMLNERAGIISALVLATSIEFVYLGKAAVTDITLTFFLTVSMLSFINKKYVLFYACAGLAVLTKGPIGLFFPGVVAFMFLFVTGNLSEIKRMRLPSGILIFSIIAVPWYAVMYHLHGSAFIDTFLGFHNVTRFTSPEHPTGVLWYYYVPVLILGFFPWTALLLQAAYHSFMHGREKFRKLIFLHVWAAVVFVFFSVAQTKLVSYILPMYPALALLIGWYVDQLWGNYYQQKRQYVWGALLCLLSSLAIGGAYWGLGEMPELSGGVHAMSIVFALMTALTLCFLWKRRIGYALASTVCGMVFFFLVLAGLLFPAAAPTFSAFKVTKQFEAIYDGTSPIYVSKFLRPGFAFYSGRYGEELLFSPKSVPDFAAILKRRKHAYFVVRDIDFARIPEQARAELEIVKTVDNKRILRTK